MREFNQTKPLKAIFDDVWLHTNVGRQYNVTFDKITLPTYIITYSQRQQVRAKLRMLFILFDYFGAEKSSNDA